MRPKNKGGRCKFFTCFRPIIDGDQELGRDLASPPCSGKEGGWRRKLRVHRSFSGTLKAAFFKTPLLKKSLSENPKLLSPKRGKLAKSLKKIPSCKTFRDPTDENFQTNSYPSSVSSNSSTRLTASAIPSSEVSLNSTRIIRRSISVDFRQLKQKSTKRDDSGSKSCYCQFKLTHEMYIFMVCLVALVFWGKAFAIVTCTSTWFLVSPRRGRRRRFKRVYSEENKKRVIMEGLLERNRSSR